MGYDCSGPVTGCSSVGWVNTTTQTQSTPCTSSGSCNSCGDLGNTGYVCSQSGGSTCSFVFKFSTQEGSDISTSPACSEGAIKIVCESNIFGFSCEHYEGTISSSIVYTKVNRTCSQTGSSTVYNRTRKDCVQTSGTTRYECYTYDCVQTATGTEYRRNYRECTVDSSTPQFSVTTTTCSYNRQQRQQTCLAIES